MNYVLLGLIALVLVTGLVAFGVGHKRWSWGTLIAAILVLLAGTGYLYVAARLAAYEWSWTRFVRGKQEQLVKVEDALAPDHNDGWRLKPIAGMKTLEQLAEERTRWQRALDRIDTWRGRSFEKASFEPPKADGQTGTLELPVGDPPPPPAEGEAAVPVEPVKPADPPLDPGATVFLFEDVPAQEGGRYLGEFQVQTAVTDAAANRYVFTVTQTEQRDAYDAAVWNQTYDSVTVYDRLPGDRWLAFSKTGGLGDDEAAMPTPTRLTIEQVEALLQEREQQTEFLSEIDRHETIADKDEWERIRGRLDSGEDLPGSYWGVVRFKQPFTVAEDLDVEADKRSFAPDEVVEFDLQTAFDLADKGQVTIEEVRYRRPLRDARTFMQGSRIYSTPERGDANAAQDGITADGIAALLATLHQDRDTLDASIARLQESRTAVETELRDTRGREQRLTEDKQSWDRDATAADRMAEAFAAEAARTAKEFDRTERAILELAAEYRNAIARLVERIDAEAPAPARPANAP